MADYLLSYQGAPMMVLEAKAEKVSASDGMHQAAQYAKRLDLRFSISTNGKEWVLTDNNSDDFEVLEAVPTPTDILDRLGVKIDWDRWGGALSAGCHFDQVAKKHIRPYQRVAIAKTLWHFAQGHDRALLLMATGTGKTYTVFQLVWKLINGGALKNERVLFLTDRNRLKDQAYLAFSGFHVTERVQIDKEVVGAGQHLVGKIFFANYQNLDEEINGKKLFQHYDSDFFDLVVVDECHRSAFGDWYGILNHFGTALQLGLTATPRALNSDGKILREEEKRRDTFIYFGEPVYSYSLRQAIDDGYLVPYMLEERITNVDEEGYVDIDGTRYTTANFERDIRMPDRTKAIAEDLWELFNKKGIQENKTIIFCVDNTHAAFMVDELRRLADDENYAARITRSERSSHQLERDFSIVGSKYPRVAVTVDLLSTGYDAPDVQNIVFVRPLRSAILYKQMKGRGTRLCQDVEKRFFTIFDYSGTSKLEDAEFDGHPANQQKSTKGVSKRRKKQKIEAAPKPIGEGISIIISSANRYVCLADGDRIPIEDYTEKSRTFVQSLAPNADQLLNGWIQKTSRIEIRDLLRDNDIYPSVYRYFMDLFDTDDVDILSKIGFDLTRVPTRGDRVNRLLDHDQQELVTEFKEGNLTQDDQYKWNFWVAALDHYRLFGIDDLEQARTYSAPQFVKQFGSFQTLTQRYGGAKNLKADLERIKECLYVPMAVS
jgi:type I restriction enzyme R subunit